MPGEEQMEEVVIRFVVGPPAGTAGGSNDTGGGPFNSVTGNTMGTANDGEPTCPT